MSTTAKIVLALGLGGLALVAVFLVRQPPGREPAPAPAGARPPPSARPSPAPDAPSGSARSTAADASSEQAPRSAAVSASAGWRAEGTVLAASGGAAIADARVDLELRLADGDSVPLGRATSAKNGAFAASLERLAGMEAAELAHARVAARATAPGHQPAEVALALASAVDQRVVFDVRLHEGAALRGRAVATGGKPVPRATVALSIADGRSGPGGLTLLSEAEADAEGQFVLGFGAGGKLLLSVRADGVGTAVREVEVEARRDRDVGDVELGGGPPLSGVALHVDGMPAQDLELWALEGETSFKPDGFAIAVRRAREVERNDGLSWSRTFTDAGGRFEFRALRPDHYAIKAADPAVIVEPRQGRWEPGQRNVELQVQSPLLVVRVVDAAGAPAPGAVVECTELGLEADGSFTPGGTRRVVARGPQAMASFSADPETPLALRARLRADRAAEKLVYFGQGAQHLEETLVLAPLGQGGRLRFQVAGADASQLGIRVALASPTTSLRDEEIGVLEADAEGAISGIPPGEHRLFVDFTGPAGAWYFPWQSARPVRVAAEGETVVPIEPVGGARLAVECALAGAPPKGLDDPAAAGLRRERFGARFVLATAGVAPGAGPERTLDLRLGAEDVVLLLPGETGEVRDLLSPGDWVVRVEGAHWISTQAPVRLVAGRRLVAHVELRAR